MFCSTVIPTIGRPTLSRAVCSLLDQAFTADDFEVIVVNDSGRPLPEMDWQHSAQVRVIDTNRRERSVARNTGAAIAGGRYLHFLDYLVPWRHSGRWITPAMRCGCTVATSRWITRGI
jgi:glycosyltransferase involved in cell wall biosynthesis